jgi:hypothetical protein
MISALVERLLKQQAPRDEFRITRARLRTLKTSLTHPIGRAAAPGRGAMRATVSEPGLDHFHLSPGINEQHDASPHLPFGAHFTFAAHLAASAAHFAALAAHLAAAAAHFTAAAAAHFAAMVAHFAAVTPEPRLTDSRLTSALRIAIDSLALS